MEEILARWSIRKYIAKPVSSNDVELLLRAAMSAPSAGNEQPWKFIVVDHRKVLRKLSNIDCNMKALETVPVGILVCGEPRLQKYSGFWVQDCAAVTQNILIGAQFLRLGTNWIGLYPIRHRIRKVRKLLALPRRIVPFAFVSIGYPAEIKEPSDRFDSRRIHSNSWSPVQDAEIQISFFESLKLFLKRHLKR